jgi:hypothetical protein
MHRTVANKFNVNRRVSMSDVAPAVATTTGDGAFERPFGDIVVCMCVCNKASISVNDDATNFKRVQTNENIEKLEEARTNEVETLNIIGNPSEAAMLRYVIDLDDAQAMRARYDVVFEVQKTFCLKFKIFH